MAVHNTWVLDLVHKLNQNGKLREIARLGFLDRGRGAISLDEDGSSYGAVYLSRTAWELAHQDELRRLAIFETIDTYLPLSQLVVVVTSPVGNEHFEVTTCLLKLD